MEHLSGADDFWLRMEQPENPLTITGVLHFEGKMTLQAFKAKLGDDLLRFRRFRQLIAGHQQLFLQPRWEDDPHFSLGRHVFHHDLPAGEVEALRGLIGELISAPLDDDKPLWDMHLVDGPLPGTTLIARIHHSLADGFSLIRLMLALIDEGCEVRLPGGAESPSLGVGGHRLEASVGRLEAARHFAERLVESGLRTLRHPVPETGPLRDAAACAAHLFTMEPDPPSGLKGPLSTRKGAAWSDRIPLEAIKARARAYGGTINDLLLGALAGALRRYLLDNDEVVEGKDLRVTVPVNVRPFEARTEELGNGFGLVFLELPVGLDSAEARLEALKARMDALKHSPEPYVTYGLMQAVGLLPALIQQQLIGLFEGKSSAIVTNMPGPTNRFRMAGQTIDDAVFFVPQSAGTGLGISIFSYAGAVRIGVAADLGLIPDPEALVAAYHAELAELGVSLKVG